MSVAEYVPSLVVCSGIAVFGQFGNANIVWATCRKRERRSPCGVFIAANAFSDFLSEANIYIIDYFVFTSDALATLRTCLLLETLPLLGTVMSSMALVVTGADRLLNVAFPLRYNKTIGSYGVLYTCTGLLIPFATGVYFVQMAYAEVALAPQRLSTCSMLAALAGRTKEPWVRFTVVVHGVALLLHALVWLCVRARAHVAAHTSKQVLRSITLLCVLVIGGHLFVGGCLQVVQCANTLFASPWLINLVISVSPAASYPVYFAMSKDYRRAFLEQLGMLACMPLFGRSLYGACSSVAPVSSRSVPTTHVWRTTGRKCP